jgi:hypothetical protein
MTGDGRHVRATLTGSRRLHGCGRDARRRAGGDHGPGRRPQRRHRGQHRHPRGERRRYAAVTKINAALDAATGGDGGITATFRRSDRAHEHERQQRHARRRLDDADAAGFAAATGPPPTACRARGPVDDRRARRCDQHQCLAARQGAGLERRAGKLRIENLSTESLTVVGASAIAVTGGTGASNTSTIGGNDVRKNLIAQFNELRRQLDKVGGDSSYNGVNLLRGDKLKVVFNEASTSVLEIQAKSTAGVVRGISTEPGSLDIAVATAAEFSDDAQLDIRLQGLADSLTTVQTQASSFGANLDGSDSPRIHPVDHQHLEDWRRQPHPGRQQRGRRQPLGAQHPPAALADRLSLASQASQAVLRLFG